MLASALATDLYQLTMIAGYVAAGRHQTTRANKLVEVVEDGRTRLVMKTSTGKKTWPGRKQIWRVMTNGRAARDVVALRDESPVAGAQPLLERVMVDGARTGPVIPIANARVWCLERVGPRASHLATNARRRPLRS